MKKAFSILKLQMMMAIVFSASIAVAESQVCEGFTHLQFVRINSGSPENAEFPPYQCADIHRFDRQFGAIVGISPEAVTWARSALVI